MRTLVVLFKEFVLLFRNLAPLFYSFILYSTLAC